MKKKILLLLCASLLVTGVSAKKKHVDNTQSNQESTNHDTIVIDGVEVPL